MVRMIEAMEASVDYAFDNTGQPENLPDRVFKAAGMGVLAVSRLGTIEFTDGSWSDAENLTGAVFTDCMTVAIHTEKAREVAGLDVLDHRQAMLESVHELMLPAHLPSSGEKSVLFSGNTAIPRIRVEQTDDGTRYLWTPRYRQIINEHNHPERGCPAFAMQSEFEGQRMNLVHATWSRYAQWWTSMEINE